MASSPDDPALSERDGLEQILCDLCGLEVGLSVYQVRDRLGISKRQWQFVRCQRCGLLYVNPRPRLEALAGYYFTEDYYAYRRPELMGCVQTARTRLKEWLAICLRGYPRAADSPKHEGSVEDSRYLRWLLSPLDGLLWAVPHYRPGGRLLDVGCGSGLYLRAMRRLGWQVSGVELSAKAAAYAREALGLDVREGSLEEAGFPDEHFDVVTLWHVLEHLPSPRRTLQEVVRVLKPDGILICEVPNIDSLQSRVMGHRWFHLDPPRHLYAFSPATLRAMLQAAGLTVLEIAPVPDLVGWSESLLATWRPFGRRNTGYDALCRWPLRLALAPLEFVVARLGYGGHLWAKAARNDRM